MPSRAKSRRCSASLPGADRERLDRYLTDMRELERRLALAADSTLADLDVPDKPNGVPPDFEEHAALMFDLLALAWAADLTRVATLLLARELSNRRLSAQRHQRGVPQLLAPLGSAGEHRSARAPERVPHAHDDRLAAAEAREHARRRRQLLDHSLVVYGSGMSNANQHDHDPLPMLLAGGARGVAGRAAHPRGRGHAGRESAARRAEQARRAGRVVRRQHGRGRDLSVRQ